MTVFEKMGTFVEGKKRGTFVEGKKRSAFVEGKDFIKEYHL